MDLIKESKAIPLLVNPKNFKPKKPVPIDPVNSFKKNSQILNIILLVGFVIFFGLFLLYTKFSKKNEFEPEGYSVAYNLNLNV
jgi:hypothetical protein